MSHKEDGLLSNWQCPQWECYRLFGNPATLKHAWLGMLGPKNAVKLKAHQSQAVNFGAACPDHFTEAGGRHKRWSPGGQMNKEAGGEVFRGCPLHAQRTGSQVGRGGLGIRPQ